MSKWTIRYGSSAVLVATAIIIVSMLAGPILITRTSSATNFLVMLTDPPTVPAGTTVLNLTYSGIALHIAYPNGTTQWLPVTATGTVNLFSLVNMSQTIASVTIPTGSAVDKIQFTIDDVDALVKGIEYNVTTLSDTLVISIKNGQVNQTLSGVLIDFNPTLVQIQATDAQGNTIYYYVLVPSATAIIIDDLNREHVKVGTIVEIGNKNKEKLVRVVEEYSKNVTIVSATLNVTGNHTDLSVTLRNDGNTTFRVFGLTLHGEFNETRTMEKNVKQNNHSEYNKTGNKQNEEHGEGDHDTEFETTEKTHPCTIPFKVNGTSLIPLFGDEKHREIDDDNYKKYSWLTLEPSQNVTLTFSGIIALRADDDKNKRPTTVVTPILDNSYTIRLTGEGYMTYNVTATTGP